MRTLILAVVTTLVAPALLAQGPRPSDEPEAERLPVRRVVLYKTGVGYFEHRARVDGAQSLTVRFTSSQLDDVLKSLTALDLGNGRITGISYNSAASTDRRLGALRLPVGEDATLTDLLTSLRGARVEVAAGSISTSGRLLSLERQTRRLGADAVAEAHLLSIVTDSGELRTYELDPSVRIRVLDRDLRDELGQYLDVLGASREQDVRRMVIRTDGAGERDVFVSYVSEVPVWKTTYRLVLPDEGTPFLQGWAIVDNTIGEDWTDVQLSLVAGAPQTFIQPISQPYYTRRPVVPLPETALLTPQTHGATLQADVQALQEAVQVTAPGEQPYVTGSMRAAKRGEEPLVGSGVAGGVGAGVPAPPPPAAARIGGALRNTRPDASGSDLGDLFEYRIDGAVTIAKNESALVPILNETVRAEKVSLWNGTWGSGRPLRAVWLTNASQLTLDGGSFSVVEEGAFAGEGLMDALEPGERRLLSYAADLGVLVAVEGDTYANWTRRLRASDGVIVQEFEARRSMTYRIRNEDAEARVVVVEHPTAADWKLGDGLEPEERTATTVRFRVPVPGRSEEVLEVPTRLLAESRVAVDRLDESFVEVLVSNGLPSADVERALGPLLDKRRQLAELQARLSNLQEQRTGIFDDQQRLRENMKALGRSDEERALLSRYTGQLGQQEDRLEALQQDIARSTEEQQQAERDLAELIATLTFEVTAPGQ